MFGLAERRRHGQLNAGAKVRWTQRGRQHFGQPRGAAAAYSARSMRRLLHSVEIATALATLPGWTLSGNTIRRSYRFADFRAAFAFMTDVAVVAEELQHHPDWSNSYADVQVALTTHDAGGLTELDIALARRIAVAAAMHHGTA
jgi:4a-hydroxytetrahydrobiopterin dehydratase